jgi:hypothetical protein
MNVHLIRSSEVSEELYWSIIDLLKQFKGPARFVPSESFVEYESKIISKELIETEEDFIEKQLFEDEEDVAYLPNSYPYEREVVTWDQFFNKCRSYRINNDIGNNEYVILLTDIANDKNWFMMMDETKRNGFIHTGDWDFYVKSDSKYPIAYEIAEMLLQSHLFDSMAELNKIVHQKPIGCINDFTGNKKDITLKLRTADICTDCQRVIINKKVPYALVHQVLSIIEGIRGQMLFKERFKYHFSPGKITFNLVQRKIIFEDLQNMIVRLTPLEAVLYYFFLTHPDGIPLNRLSEYETELYRIYQKCSVANSDNNIAAMRNSIKALVNPLENSLNEKFSRIKSKLTAALGVDLAGYYYIAKDNESSKYRMLFNRRLLTLA